MDICEHGENIYIMNDCIDDRKNAYYLKSFFLKVYWHSSAHIMGEAMERVYGGCLCYGPPIENGFYYDMFLENE